MQSPDAHQDATRQKLAEIALAESEQKFHTAFDSCPVPASIANVADGRFIEVNANYERDFGWRRDDLIGKTSVEVGIWPDAVTRQQWLDAMQQTSRLVNYETVWMHKNGARRHVSLSGALTELYGQPCILAYATDITERKRAECETLKIKNKLESILNAIPDLLFEVGLDGRYHDYHSRRDDLLAVPVAMLLGKTFAEVLPPEAAHTCLSALQEARENGLSTGKEFTLPLAQGQRWFELSVAAKQAGDDLDPRFIMLSRDVTERKRAEADLRIAAVAFESREAMMVTDAASVILRINQAFTAITGYTAEEAVGQTPRLLRSSRHNADFYVAMWDSIKSTGTWQGEVWDRRKDGTEYPKWLTISAVKDSDGSVTNYIGTHHDITERKQAEARINELAFYDPLTELPNRTLLQDRMKQIIAASGRSETYGALLLIDLDNFKTLNDTLGHEIGDLLLKQAAERLVKCVREEDTVARLGGDEFVVVLANLGAQPGEAANATEAVAEKILAILNQAYLFGNSSHSSSASIGATLFNGPLISFDGLMKQAELAMYKAKETGRNKVRFFDPAMEVAVQERSALESDLRYALQEGQFFLHYQAQVADKGVATGAEVLLRWKHPGRGMVSPAEFIPLAEESGLILPLGNWVLETACKQLAQWSIQPELADLTLAVNVSAQQFRQPGFVAQVLSIVESTGANPKRLKLELTESLLVHNLDEVIEKMFALKARGVGFSLDDFGTGYSSLSYLKKLPLDQLKIDQSFVRDVLIDPNDAAIAKTIVALAQTLGLGVIAEGVETAAQRDFLVKAGCHAHQGYFFSRPIPIADFEAFARRV